MRGACGVNESNRSTCTWLTPREPSLALNPEDTITLGESRGACDDSCCGQCEWPSVAPLVAGSQVRDHV